TTAYRSVRSSPSIVLQSTYITPGLEAQDVVVPFKFDWIASEISYGNPVGTVRVARPLDRNAPGQLWAAGAGCQRHHRPYDVPLSGPTPGEPASRRVRSDGAEPLHPRSFDHAVEIRRWAVTAGGAQLEIGTVIVQHGVSFRIGWIERVRSIE